MLNEFDNISMKIVQGSLFLNMLASVDSPNVMYTL